ncbi:tRNA pseudouridine(55) synthase TruB [Aurantimonas sp. C2-6-R+9]|uniref:tRNA pseudouridine(55) synthase TruB n=1 Tax=unclassified Aurantimonas TaxID=2638230 RepID=UPI002E19AFB5|nr:MULTISPECIES: tRNA pseudouridine(55) synthase TruB [unclassified Aurantimonas]MEC5289572.1 tRNA pseudouridine(55) synthase TruB [Aurantimonas sp. C2-3-R2]MEC5379537.1 tRNA pseudouridine(55) synthase TruB [Aurantimonas sp. C2-6-R+9]MEC5410653.1 tRNA pseudouridine(55) synthase TruB [Aurantimonas sp. C2-4-R8]
MARRGKKPKGRPINGWIILDKPKGMGSTEAVSKLKWLYFAQKAGHAGTLDPLASGMLPIAFGDATKTVPFVMEGRKVYRFTVRWGAETTTDDTEGPVVHSSETRPSEAEIEARLADYTGEIEQVPPSFSAIKIAGERAYDLAREGETVEIAARTVSVHRLDIVDCPDADTTVFEAECGKGTYVRAIARDLGRDLGCYGHVIELRRVSVGAFGEDDLVPLEELEAAAEEGREELDAEALEAGAKARVVDFEPLDEYLVAPEVALADLYEVALTDDQAGRVLSGNAVLLRGRDAPAFCDEAYATGHGRLVALGAIEEGAFKPKRVFGGKG